MRGWMRWMGMAMLLAFFCGCVNGGDVIVETEKEPWSAPSTQAERREPETSAIPPVEKSEAPPPEEPEEPVEFVDSSIEKAVRRSLKQWDEPIYPRQAKEIKSLYTDRRDPVYTLVDLRHLENLESLSIREAGLRSLEGIQSLESLAFLTLIGNELTSDALWLLAELPGLTNLDISENRITHLEPLADLNGLSVLSLTGNQVSDLSALGEMSQLHFLSAESNLITDVTPLIGLENLQRVWLGNNRISDPDLLRQLDVELLDVSGNPMTQEEIATLYSPEEKALHALSLTRQIGGGTAHTFTIQAYNGGEGQAAHPQLHLSTRSIAVTDTDTGNLVQTILPYAYNHGDDPFWWYLPDNPEQEFAGMSVEDLNFDGYADLQVYLWTPGTSMMIYAACWVWDPSLGQYVYDWDLSQINISKVDPDSRQLITQTRLSAMSYQDIWYEYRSGKLTRVREEERSYTYDADPPYITVDTWELIDEVWVHTVREEEPDKEQ